MVSQPQRMDERHELLLIGRQCRRPDQPVRFGVIRPVVQRHPVGVQPGGVRGEFPGSMAAAGNSPVPNSLSHTALYFMLKVPG